MEAIVLAGGLGTRLKGVVKDIPKPMAPIQDLPFLRYILEWLFESGVKHATLAVGYKYEHIQSYFGQSYKTMSLHYAVENEPLGTGGGIRNALPYCKNEHFLLINGDTFFKVDLKALMQFHLREKSDLTLSLKELQDFDRYGSVALEGNIIQQFREKQYLDKGLINGGVYAVHKKIFAPFALGEKFSFEQDIMEKGVSAFKMRGQVSDAYFIDIGIPADYEKAQADLPAIFPLDV